MYVQPIFKPTWIIFRLFQPVQPLTIQVDLLCSAWNEKVTGSAPFVQNDKIDLRINEGVSIASLLERKLGWPAKLIPLWLIRKLYSLSSSYLPDLTLMWRALYTRERFSENLKRKSVCAQAVIYSGATCEYAFRTCHWNKRKQWPAWHSFSFDTIKSSFAKLYPYSEHSYD